MVEYGMKSDKQKLEFLKKFSKALIAVGKTIDFLTTDDSIPIDKKEQQAADLFASKIQALVASELATETNEREDKRQEMEKFISHSMSKLGIPKIEITDDDGTVHGTLYHEYDPSCDCENCKKLRKYHN